MHRMIIGCGSDDHKGLCYKIRVMKTEHITKSKQHVTATSISLEDYLRNKLQKGNKQQSDDKLIECRFTKIHNNEQLNEMERERKTEPKVTQPTENMNTVSNERPAQSTANKVLKKEPWRQTQNQEKQDQDGSVGKQTGYVISRTILH